MDKPTPLVIAGCNGSGKSSFSKALVAPKNISAFDYDKVYIEKYTSLKDSELRDVMAHNLSREELKKSIKEAIKKQGFVSLFS